MWFVNATLSSKPPHRSPATVARTCRPTVRSRFRSRGSERSA